MYFTKNRYIGLAEAPGEAHIFVPRDLSTKLVFEWVGTEHAHILT